MPATVATAASGMTTAPTTAQGPNVPINVTHLSDTPVELLVDWQGAGVRAQLRGVRDSPA